MDRHWVGVRCDVSGASEATSAVAAEDERTSNENEIAMAGTHDQRYIIAERLST